MDRYKRIGIPFVALLLALTFSISAGASKAKTKNSQKQSQSADKIDLNSASSSDLDGLPGVGPANAKKIIDGRPYSSFSDVVKRSGVPEGTLEKIRPMVKVSRGSKTTEAKSDEAAASGESSKASEQAPSDQSSKASKQAPDTDESKASGMPQSDQAAAGSGMVWVNLETKVFHREGDRWYGKTKHGKYMSESDAIKAGYRPAKNGADKEKE